MNIYVFFLVMFAAFTHASWNFFSKKVSGNLKVIVLGLWFVNLSMLPFSVYHIIKFGINPHIFYFALITGSSHILYYWSLVSGYRNGDISTVYPIARGLAVSGTAVCAFLFLKEDINFKGGIGVAVIVFGVLVLSLHKKISLSDLKAMKYALLVGIAVIFYSVFDKVAVAYAHPVVYMNMKDLYAISIMSPFVFRRGWQDIEETLKKSWKYSALIGYGSFGTYLLILFAFTLERAGYVSAVREFSIVIGSVFGFVFLKEKITVNKTAGILFILAGLVFIKIA